MTLTINFVDNTEAAPKLMATCNLDVDTNEPDGIKAEYQQVIQEIHAETAAELLARATETVLSRHPESVLLSVNCRPGQHSQCQYAQERHTQCGIHQLTGLKNQHHAGKLKIRRI